MATINSNQDYDLITTLTFASASGTCKIKLYRGVFAAHSGTVYYRAGTSGSWTSLSVSGTSTTFPVSSTTMQLAHDWNKSVNLYMTPSFNGQKTNLTSIAISQKAAVTGVVGDFFFYDFARFCDAITTLDVPDTSGVTSTGDAFFELYAPFCDSLTSLQVPDTSSVTSAGSNFMDAYAKESKALTSLEAPDTSSVITVGNNFLSNYAATCEGLTSLAVPDTSKITTAGGNFLRVYAIRCYGLTSIGIPDTSSLTSAGAGFMYYYASYITTLTRLDLPAAGWFKTHNVDWNLPSGLLNNLKGYTTNQTDKDDWDDLVVSGETLHTNYIQDTNDIILELPKSTPTVTTQPVIVTGENTATGNGNVTSDGNDTITERGVVWSTTANPTTADSKKSVAGTTGAFTAAITGLTTDTTYHVRAYAINGEGTSYGADVLFVAGFEVFSKGMMSSLPTDTADLPTIYTTTQKSYVVYIDSDIVEVMGGVSGDYVIQQYKKITTDTAINITVTLQVSEDPSVNSVYLEAYNQVSDTWVQIDVNNSASVDTNLALSGSVASAEYRDANDVVTFRVHQKI